MELHNKYVTIDRHFVSLTTTLWGKRKTIRMSGPFLSNVRFGKMSPPARLYTSIQEFHIIFCTAHCIATNKPHSNTMRTCHFDFSPLRSTAATYTIQPPFSRSQPIDDAVRPQHYRVRPTDDARIKGHLKKREREN